jgi:hypothetical protein
MLNVRLSKLFASRATRSIEIIADVFNVFSLLGWRIGDIREMPGGGSVPLLALTGYDVAHRRGVYGFIPGKQASISNDVSRWRIQLGARVSF